jgi:hypothetical protein
MACNSPEALPIPCHRKVLRTIWWPYRYVTLLFHLTPMKHKYDTDTSALIIIDCRMCWWYVGIGHRHVSLIKHTFNLKYLYYSLTLFSLTKHGKSEIDSSFDGCVSFLAICPTGKRSMTKLARISDYFWSEVCPSSALKWDIHQIWRNTWQQRD